MRVLFDGQIGARRARVLTTERADGSFHPDHVDHDDIRTRQVELTGRAWAMLDEVHGTARHEVGAGDDDAVTCGRGDVLVGSATGPPVAVWVGDCAPLLLLGRDGTVVGVHAGWRGLAAGVVDVGVDALVDRGEAVAAAVLGPVIHPCCYPFGEADLAAVSGGAALDRAEIAATSRDGQLALDVPATVRAVLRRRGVELDVTGPCTGCDDTWFSHRRRGELGRHAVVAWHDPSSGRG